MNRSNTQVQLSHLRLPPLASAQLKQQYCHLLLEGHHLNTIMSHSIHNSTRILNGFLFQLLAHFFCINHHNSAYSPQDEKFRQILLHRLNLENLNICSASGSNITGPSYQRKHQHQYQQKHHQQQKH